MIQFNFPWSNARLFSNEKLLKGYFQFGVEHLNVNGLLKIGIVDVRSQYYRSYGFDFEKSKLTSKVLKSLYKSDNETDDESVDESEGESDKQSDDEEYADELDEVIFEKYAQEPFTSKYLKYRHVANDRDKDIHFEIQRHGIEITYRRV